VALFLLSLLAFTCSRAYEQQYYVGDTGPNGGTVTSVTLESVLSNSTVELVGDFEDTTYTYVYTETIVEEVETTETITTTTYEIVSTETTANMLLGSLPSSSSGVVLDHTYNDTSTTGHIHTDYQGGSVTYTEDLTDYFTVDEINEGFTLYGEADAYACTNQIGGHCDSGTLDTFSITLKVVDPTTGEDYYKTTTWSIGNTWNTYNTSLTVPSNTLGSDAQALATFYGMDNGYWGGWYGPVIDDMKMYAVYNQLQEIITQTTNIIIEEIESSISTTEYETDSVYIPPVMVDVYEPIIETVADFTVEVSTEFDSFEMNIEVTESDSGDMQIEISTMDESGDMEIEIIEVEMEETSPEPQQEQEAEEEQEESEESEDDNKKESTSKSTKEKVAQTILAKVMETADTIAVNNTKLAVMASLSDTEGFAKYQAKQLQDAELYISEIMYDSKQLNDPYAKPYSLAQDYIMEQMVDLQWQN
jgi:hypothetical protein